MDNLLQLVQSKAQAWINSPVIDDATKAEVKSLLAKKDPKNSLIIFIKTLNSEQEVSEALWAPAPTA